MTLPHRASIALLSAIPLFSQANTGSIQGTVRDSLDAVIPFASVTATNTATGVARSSPVNASGEYTIPFLSPGTYSVTAEAKGFRRSALDGIVVRVGDRLAIDLKLDPGAQTEVVTVRATTPLLEASSVTLGQVVETKQILDLPLNGRDALSLAALAPGVIPQDPSPTAAVQLGNTVPGINGSNFATAGVAIDGASNGTPRGTTYLNIYSPNVDSVAEFKVQTNSMSAEFGRSNGGTITMVTKSGTNQFHGTAYWFLRNRAFDANDFFSNRAGLPLGKLHRHQAGGTIGGPVAIPRLYNGKDRTFFFFDYEAYREMIGNPNTFTVPTALERAGDFSNTLNAQGRLIQIFDPLNTVPNANGVGVTRLQFPGNTIPPPRIDPVARRMVALYPLPTVVAPTGNLPLNSARNNKNDTFNIRLDQYSGRHHFFGRGSYQQPWVGEPNYYGGIGNPTNPPLLQRRRFAGVQDVYTVSPTTILTFNYNVVYQYGTRSAWSNGYDITQLGFPSNFRDGQQVRAIPVTTVTSFSGLGNGAQNYSTQTTHTIDGSLSRNFSRHRLKTGAEFRAFYNNQLQNNNGSGSFSFSQAFTQGPNPNQASATAGNSIASMLLGLPAGGSVTNQPATSFLSSYPAVYVQDDITLTRTFTLFAGLRWESNLTRTERYDRMSVLNLAKESPIARQAPSLGLKGQMEYRQGDRRRLIDSDKRNLGPRIGFAWRAAGQMVVRAAYGLFYGLSAADATTSTAFADGFSSVTSVVTSLNDVNPFQTMSDPYPNGIRPPATAGSMTPSLNIGQTSNSAILSLRTGQFQQWNFTLQRSVGSSLLLEAAYAGNKGSHTSVANIQLNSLTAEQMALGAFTQELVPNPFFGVITDPTSALSREQIARRSLMLPYPQYTTISSEAPSLGSSTYHSLQTKVQRRMANGFTMLVSYTIGKTLTNATGAGIADPNNLRAERSVASYDVSQRLVFSGMWELPIGAGKRIGSGWSRSLDLVLGRWQVNGIAAFQKGFPLALTSTGALRPDRVRPVEELTGATQARLTRYFDTAAFVIPRQFTYGNNPPTSPDIRRPGLNNFDLSLFKNFRLMEKLTAQFRFESFNTLNRAQFGAPGTQNGTAAFGVITFQQNQPRKLQLAMKMIF